MLSICIQATSSAFVRPSEAITNHCKSTTAKDRPNMRYTLNEKPFQTPKQMEGKIWKKNSSNLTHCVKSLPLTYWWDFIIVMDPWLIKGVSISFVIWIRTEARRDWSQIFTGDLWLQFGRMFFRTTLLSKNMISGNMYTNHTGLRKWIDH